MAGRAAGGASRALRRGGGTAIAGAIAQRIDSALPARLAGQIGHGCALVTGTNGKTTTARMLAAAAREAGLQPLANPSGSNLMRGITAALISETGATGSIRNGADRVGIFEVDEAVLPHAVRALRPRAVIFTNLFRDQLDRYGEADAVVSIWQRAISDLLPDATLVVNADDPAVASLIEAAERPVLTYGIDDVSQAIDEPEHASDYKLCLTCDEELDYDATFYGHIGHWCCPGCGRTRPAPDVRALSIDANRDGSAAVSIATADGEREFYLPLSGLYNVANALAATAGAVALGLPMDAALRALAAFLPAFGRQERFRVEGRDVVVLLGKNPTGLNQVLRTISAGQGAQHLLFFLNDGIADGRDISWIWDADYEIIAAGARGVTVSGTRADELALRLSYADVAAEPRVVTETRAAMDAALAQTPPGEMLYVLPTYTAMLEVRELLAARAGVRPYWEDTP